MPWKESSVMDERLRFAISPRFSLRLELESIGGEGGDVVSFGAQVRF
jgi:hypothetical protein